METSAVRDQNHKILAAVMIFVNQTQKKIAEKALHESESKYRLLAENVIDTIWVLDMDFNFTYVNESIQTLLGYSPEEFVETNLRQHIAQKDFEKIMAIVGEKSIWKSITPGSIFEVSLKRRNGTSVPVEVHGKTFFNKNGLPITIQGVVRDISERKSSEKERLFLQEKLNQAKKLESVGRLAGGVAHDFNNMLMTIQGYTDLCLQETANNNETREFLNEIAKATDRSIQLTRQLLTFARKQTIIPKVISLNDSVESILKLLKKLIGENISLEWEKDENLWLIKMDPAQVDQIIANLVLNSRDAIENTGKIIIKTKNIEVSKEDLEQNSSATLGNFVLISVEDDGCGMDENTLSIAFEPFFTTKSSDKGTGLGLATVYGVVKQNDGFLKVQS